jgi:hypothetical protein
MPSAEKKLGGWREHFVREVARGLRQAERDARRRAIREAVDIVGELAEGDSEFTSGKHSNAYVLHVAASRVSHLERDR